ncbi:MAG TPA: polynucleotide adenylyltransferase PcnB [Polyangia bacterium]|nr:polynucleotide adenylyltransferase PcnB [Polyangia bacterium]
MNIAPDQIDPDAVKVVQRLRDSGFAAYLVGGCVRDLLLGRKPKDFDVVTSATPPEIKKHFKNCRIIGRRFRLAHIFYGPKIIETSTFRANPREMEEDDGEGPEIESGDLLIRRDNVFGTPEQDARRRDFTINGLFYDIQTRQVIDHVDGLPDLEARVVRTIGDPDIRFREDPIRILRAVKFAARCDLTIEPETYRRMMEHRQEIAKCAQARVSEEFYRLLRAGAAKRSLELLVETDLLELLVPDLAKSLKGEPADAEAALRRARLWRYLEALDQSTLRRPVAPTNALLLAALLLPPLRDALDPDSNGVRDIGQMVTQSLVPPLERLRPSRRDSELARQILLALRKLLPSRRPRRSRRELEGREFFGEAMRLAEIVALAEAADPSLASRPILAPGTTLADLPAEPVADEIDAVDIELLGRDQRDQRPHDRHRRGRGGKPPAAAPPPPADLGSLAAAARALLTPDLRPAFLGSGGFGGPWASRAD